MVGAILIIQDIQLDVSVLAYLYSLGQILYGPGTQQSIPSTKRLSGKVLDVEPGSLRLKGPRNRIKQHGLQRDDIVQVHPAVLRRDGKDL